jgi:hypothetical protein
LDPRYPTVHNSQATLRKRQDYCEREVDEVELQGGRVYLHLGAAATNHHGGSRLRAWPRSTLTKRRPCVGCAPPFGFVMVLRIIDHDGQGQDDEEPIEDSEPPAPADR